MTAVAGIAVLVIGPNAMEGLVNALQGDPRVATALRVESLPDAEGALAGARIDGVVLATTTEQPDDMSADTLHAALTEIPLVLYEDRNQGDIGGPRRLASHGLGAQVCALAAPHDPEATGRAIVEVFTAGATPPDTPSWPATTPAAPSTFISYSRQDKEQVRALRRRLGEDGIRCWYDEEDIKPGQDWDLEVRRAISGCRFMLVCLSAKSVSTAGYVHRELRMALEKASDQPEGSIFLIPVRLEDCPLPDSLRRWQGVDLHDSGGYSLLLSVLREGG
jgi:hypothetical protein